MRLHKRIIILLVIITISLELTNAKKRNSGGSKPSKPPGSTIKKLKKAALIGVGVYAGYKLTKAAAKFANVRFMSYSKCSNWRRISKLVSKFEFSFTFWYFAGANLPNAKLQNCNLQTGQLISCKHVNQFWLNLPLSNSKK